MGFSLYILHKNGSSYTTRFFEHGFYKPWQLNSRTSTMKNFCKNTWRLLPVNYFRRKAPRRCSPGFFIYFWWVSSSKTLNISLIGCQYERSINHFSFEIVISMPIVSDSIDSNLVIGFLYEDYFSTTVCVTVSLRLRKLVIVYLKLRLRVAGV